MNYDTSNKRFLFTLVTQSGQLNMISWSTIGGGYYLQSSVIAKFDVESYIDGTLDASKQIYYMVFGNSSGIGLASFSTSSPNSPISSNGLNCGTQGLIINYVYLDSSTSTIWGVGSTWTGGLKYHVLSIQTSSLKCVVNPFKSSEFGIATSYSYNPSTKTLYVGWAPNGPGKIYTVNVQTGATTGYVVESGVVTDLEVEF